jgi:ABC-type multidrug transport system ATPase subunit
VQKPWYFIFTEPYAWAKKKYSNKVDEAAKKPALTDEELYLADKLKEVEDDDAQAERARVNGMNLSETSSEFPLIIKNIRKVYGSGKIANKSMCLAVEKNMVFGLLGPNGAGKSTLISMMTGLYPPSNGTAYVAGYDIRTEMSKVYLNIGVCPQHDILWEDLTCEEHILFYARVRGVPVEQESAVVVKALTDVNLLQYRYRLSKTLSGGEKRRLSIAIALGGDAPLVFLDEPTTGLDPEVRRVIWTIIQNAKQGKTIILTTHSMEEADILSARIGIMALGTLRCLGTPLHLKKKYGRGFTLTLSFYKDADRKPEMLSRADAGAKIESTILPQGKFRKLDQAGVTGSSTYEFDDDGSGVVSRLLDQMEAMKESLGVEDWGISQTSLEEVFLNIVKDSDADGSAK